LGWQSKKLQMQGANSEDRGTPQRLMMQRNAAYGAFYKAINDVIFVN